MKTLLIGCGKMGGALLTQWAKDETFTFTVVDPATENAPQNVTLVHDKEVLSGQTFDLIIVAIKPQLVDSILPDYAPLLSKGGCVASIAAGCSFERLRRAVGNVPIIRIMPNLPSAIGSGVSGLCASDITQTKHKQAMERLIKHAGTAVWVDTEDQLDRVTAISGSGPGYVFEITRAYVEAAKALGFTTEQAHDLVLGTMAGTLKMAASSSDTLEELRNCVTSKNGTTEAGLNALNGDGALSQLLIKTTEAAYRRAVALR